MTNPKTIQELDLLNILRSKFFLRIAQKTGWGKNQIEKEFNEAVIETLSENRMKGVSFGSPI